jgi:hypothetical protein
MNCSTHLHFLIRKQLQSFSFNQHFFAGGQTVVHPLCGVDHTWEGAGVDQSCDDANSGIGSWAEGTLLIVPSIPGHGMVEVGAAAAEDGCAYPALAEPVGTGAEADGVGGATDADGGVGGVDCEVSLFGVSGLT